MNVPEQKGVSGMPADALERLLSAVAAGDEPASEHAALFALLRAASGPAEPGAQPGESAVLAAFGELVPVRRMRPRPLHWLVESRSRIAAATGACVLVLGGGVAAAATGSLPDTAQGAAHDVLGAIGVHVPNHPGHSGEHGNGTSGTTPGHTGAHPTPRPSGSTGKPTHPVHPTLPAHPSHPSHPTHPTPGTHPTPEPHSTHAAPHSGSRPTVPVPTFGSHVRVH